jgi:hypothetical protein
VAAWLRRTASCRRPRGQLAEPYRHELSGHWEKAAQPNRNAAAAQAAKLGLLA